MKGRALKKEYDILIWSLYIIAPIVGWNLYGIITAIVGLILAYLFDLFFPKWKRDLTWEDINIALNNIYKYGNVPCELCFYIKKRKVFIYRDVKDFTAKGQPPLSGLETRMAVRIPVKDWEDIFDKKDYSRFLKMYGEMGMYSKKRGPEAYVLFTERGVKDCIEMLKILFEKAADGLQPYICAQSLVNSKRIIWIEHPKEDRGMAKGNDG